MKSKRHKTPVINIGGVSLGGNHPVVVQAMTDTDTTYIKKQLTIFYLLSVKKNRTANHILSFF